MAAGSWSPVSVAAPGAPLLVPELVIHARRGLVPVDFRELWLYRELFVFLIWRDILVRYKQTAIGVFWAVLQPLLTMVIFTVVFGQLAGLSSKGASYAVMTFAALLPWTFFSNAMSMSSESVVSQGSIISKVYFPRLIVPASAVLSGTVDLVIALVMLVVLMLWTGVHFSPLLLLLPLFVLLAGLAALGVGLWLSALNVKYRDIKHVVPFLVRMGMYVSPVAFMTEVVRTKLITAVPGWGEWLFFVFCLNPLVGVIDGFRWCVLGPDFTPYWPGFWASLIVVVLLVVTGAYFFRWAEKTFSDVI